MMIPGVLTYLNLVVSVYDKWRIQDCLQGLGGVGGVHVKRRRTIGEFGGYRIPSKGKFLKYIIGAKL